MNTVTAATVDNAEPSTSPTPQVWRDAVLYLLLAAGVGSAWQVSQLGLFESGDDIGYWIAVCGGSMMLMLFSYPLRKYWQRLQGVGRVKSWFVAHMVLGIGGPWLVLVHSNFRIGSLNAGVALTSMLIVVASGVVGRFIHVRVHRGLNGERTTLKELQRRAGLVESDARSRLRFAPRVEAMLLAFERHELEARPGWPTHLRQVLWLPVQHLLTYRRCAIELRAPLQALAQQQAWTKADALRRQRQARRLVWRYLLAVVRVAQYAAYARVFALWHVAHLPFVYLFVFSAVVHVVAVHAY